MSAAGRIGAEDRAAFYGAAILGLRALDARETTPRRFGGDAEARWMQFAGSLGASDRIDTLLRDAAGVWGAAFSPTDCFSFFGLADDEPFGPDWGAIDDQTAKRLLADIDAPATLEHIVNKLKLNVSPESVPLSAITPSTKLVVAGGSAIIAVANAFAEDSALSWTDQVVVVAHAPMFRQLAGLAAVLLGARGRTTLVHASDDADGVLRSAGFAHLDLAVVSADAETEAADFARKVGGR